MYFIVFLYGIVWVLNITKYNSDFNCNESKYCILELKMEFWHKKPFSIRFVHKSRKLSNFEPTFDYIMLRNLRTVRPIFQKIAPKVAQDFKEKSHESLRRGKNYRAKRWGPPPPVLLGLKDFYFFKQLSYVIFAHLVLEFKTDILRSFIIIMGLPGDES